jgi:hypothetical protein
LRDELIGALLGAAGLAIVGAAVLTKQPVVSIIRPVAHIQPTAPLPLPPGQEGYYLGRPLNDQLNAVPPEWAPALSYIPPRPTNTYSYRYEQSPRLLGAVGGYTTGTSGAFEKANPIPATTDPWRQDLKRFGPYPARASSIFGMGSQDANPADARGPGIRASTPFSYYQYSTGNMVY